jgi:hypothetical protein
VDELAKSFLEIAFHLPIPIPKKVIGPKGSKYKLEEGKRKGKSTKLKAKKEMSRRRRNMMKDID